MNSAFILVEKFWKNPLTLGMVVDIMTKCA
jgi:hypothetical protein